VLQELWLRLLGNKSPEDERRCGETNLKVEREASDVLKQMIRPKKDVRFTPCRNSVPTVGNAPPQQQAGRPTAGEEPR